MLCPNASQPISGLYAWCDSIIATHSVCGAFSSAWPEYSTVSPVFSLVWPDLVPLVSPNPRILILYALFSLAICAVLLASYMVLTFHIPTFEISLVDKKGIGDVASFRLSPHSVLAFSNGGFLPRKLSRVYLINVSATSFFYEVGLLNPCSPPNLECQEVITTSVGF